jgi:TldD protein
MKDIASWALGTAKLRGASLAEARIVDERNRSLATKNGRISGASDSESLGIGIRVIANGGFGFAATDDLSREGVQGCAARAVEIAGASSSVKSHELYLVPEPLAKAEWASPCQIDPFSIAIEKNLDLLFAIDAALLAVKGVTLAETNMNFRRYEQWFYSSEGSEIHQTTITSGAGYAAYSFEGTEIQKRSYPNSYGGQFQGRGY